MVIIVASGDDLVLVGRNAHWLTLAVGMFAGIGNEPPLEYIFLAQIGGLRTVSLMISIVLFCGQSIKIILVVVGFFKVIMDRKQIT